jgi:hypothetical protein
MDEKLDKFITEMLLNYPRKDAAAAREKQVPSLLVLANWLGLSIIYCTCLVLAVDAVFWGC